MNGMAKKKIPHHNPESSEDRGDNIPPQLKKYYIVSPELISVEIDLEQMVAKVSPEYVCLEKEDRLLFLYGPDEVIIRSEACPKGPYYGYKKTHDVAMWERNVPKGIYRPMRYLEYELRPLE